VRQAPPPDGIYRGVPFQDYFSWSAVSNSTLGRFAKYPALCKTEQADTPALLFGRAVHCAVLEPDQFAERYQPMDLGRSKAAKAARAEAEEAGYTPLDASAHQEALDIAASVRNHPACGLVLSAGEAEVSIVWTDETGLRCKARIDWLAPSVAADLKTTKDASPEGFARAVATYRYHVQQAHYLAGCEALGIEAEAFLFMAVEKTAPYPVACYQLSDATSNAGFRLWRHHLRGFAICETAGRWPAYSDEIETLNLPAWAMNEPSYDDQSF